MTHTADRPAEGMHDVEEPTSGLRMYARVMRAPGIPIWVAIVLCQRIPIAMSPLALVYLGHAATGSYASGALLAGTFAFAEAIAAGPGGRRFDRLPAGPELRLVLAIQAIALGVAAPPLFGVGMPLWLLLVLAAVAGGVASGAHGGLRALLLRTVPASTHQAALSLEATLTTLLWAVGPVAVAAVAALTAEIVPMLIIAAVAAAGVLLATRINDPGPSASVASHARGDGVLALTWPALLQEGAVMLCVGAAYTALPPLLEAQSGNAGLAGPVLGGFALAGIVGGLVYGARAWPGPFRLQSAALVVALGVAVAAAASSPSLLAITAFVVVAGLFGTPALTARAAGVQALLPERRWATGFSALYAAGGVGFGVAGLVTAGLVDSSGARVALLASAGIAIVITVISAAAERRIAGSHQ